MHNLLIIKEGEMKKQSSGIGLLVSIFMVCALFMACGAQDQSKTQMDQAAIEKVVAKVLSQQTDSSTRMDMVKQSTLENIVKRGELRVGFEAGYMPFEMADKKGQFVGFDIDLAEEMAKAMGVKFVPVNTAWDGIIPALLTDKFDIIMSGMTVTQERNLKINFADPVIIVGQTILLNPKHKDKVKSYKDLNAPEFTVTSKLGTTGEQAVKKYIPNCSYKSFETESEAALEVVTGKADAYVYDKPNCVVFMAEQGADKLVFLDEPFTYEPLAWAIRKGDPDFMNWLNNFLRQVKNDGRYQALYEKWILSTDWYQNVK